MKSHDVIATLIRHRPELEALGIDHLYLFGSVARGEASDQSDVDLLAEFNPNVRIGFAFVSIRNRLESLLGTRVDLLGGPIEKPGLKQRIESEAVLAF